MQKNKKSKTVKNYKNAYINSVFKGFLTGVISLIIFLSIASLIILNLDIDKNYFFILVLVSSGLASVCCSLFSSVSVNSNRLLIGMISSVLIVIFQFVILIFFNSVDLSPKTYIIFPIDFVCGFAGCVLGSNIRK